jgi:hypothetical protein
MHPVLQKAELTCTLKGTICFATKFFYKPVPSSVRTGVTGSDLKLMLEKTQDNEIFRSKK